MNKIIYPNNISFDGPFLIGYNNLVELDNIIEESWKNIVTINEEKLKIKVEEQIRLSPNRNKEEVEKELRDSYLFKISKILNIFFKSDNKLECNTFQEAIIEPSIKNEIPIGFNYIIKTYDINVEVSLSKSQSGGLNISVSSNNDAIINSILFKLTLWAESNQSKKWIQKWRDNFAIVWLLFGLYLLISSTLISNKNEYYKNILTPKAAYLLKDGIDSLEQGKALELLLYSNYKIAPPNIEVENSSYTNWYFLTAIILIIIVILSFPPRTYIGIGKGISKIRFWKTWLKIITYYIPISIILPIIINKVSNLF